MGTPGRFTATRDQPPLVRGVCRAARCATAFEVDVPVQGAVPGIVRQHHGLISERSTTSAHPHGQHRRTVRRVAP
jgi:hypothetical protein